MNRELFYTALRRRHSGVFGTRLAQKQVEGMENLLNVWEQHFHADPIDLLAYDLATAFHETAHTMQPITERGSRAYFSKYEPGTQLGRVLGNTLKGDGFRFRGEGHVQNTGRRNARVASHRLNESFHLNIDLEVNPSKRGDPFISALSLFLGNKEGWWTGKDLLKYLDGEDESDAEDLREFINARRVVNGTDKAKKIGIYALSFERALKEAGYKPSEPGTLPPEMPFPSVVMKHRNISKPAPVTPSDGVWARLFKAIATAIRNM